MTEYLVLNEHTLIYRRPEFGALAGVLQGDIFAGGHDWKNGTCAPLPGIDQLRPATLADFERFRVCPKGHIA